MRIGFIITNSNHHLAYTKCIIDILESNEEITVLNLSHIRGGEVKKVGNVRNLMPFKYLAKRSRSLSTSIVNNNVRPIRGRLIKLLRSVFGSLVASVILLFFVRKKIVFVFNDIAFPMNHVTDLLNAFGVRVILVQEGMRWDTPLTNSLQYGSKASTIWTWGFYSHQYFSRKYPDKDVQILGKPTERQMISVSNNQMKKEQRREIYIGLFTNPIEQLGYGDENFRRNLVTRFVSNILDSCHNVRIFIRPHPGEAIKFYEDLCRVNKAVEFFEDGEITENIKRIDAGIILASTVGLELGYQGVPFAQIKMNEWGYAFDYVDNGGVYGIDLDEKISLERLLSSTVSPQYLENHITSPLRASLIQGIRI